ncbi:MAG: hypothetical protein ACOC2U_00015 [bacterium]
MQYTIKVFKKDHCILESTIEANTYEEALEKFEKREKASKQKEKFKIYIKELKFELIDVSTHEKIDYMQSATIIKYIAVKGQQKFESTCRFNGIVTSEEAKRIIDTNLNE